MKKLSKLFWISRPVSWPNTAYPFAAAYILAGFASSSVDLWTLIIGTLYFLGPYNLLMYGVNDIFDYESDIKNPRKGGVEGLKESRAFHPVVARAVVLTNAPFLLYLFYIGSWESRAVLAAVIFAVIAYSLKGLRFKERPVLDSVTSSLHFVGPLLFGLALQGFPADAWIYVIAFFMWGMASHAFGAIQDIIPDRKAGIASIATVFGARATVWFSLSLYGAASLLMAAQAGMLIILSFVGLLYVLNVAPYLTISDDESGRTNTAWRRFLWLNYISGAVITLLILSNWL